MNLVLCLQFYHGDRARAMRLARLIADIEPVRREDVEFMFVPRFDCEVDETFVSLVEQKFKCAFFRTHTQWQGWPAGPNGMIRDLLLEGQRRVAKGWLGATDSLLLIEPDCVPVTPDWLNVLIAEWQLALSADKWMMGTWRMSGGAMGHVNGNCIVRPDFASLVDLSCITQHFAWDCAIVPQVKDRWHKTNLIRNLFQETNVTEERMVGRWIGEQMPVLVHGVKDESAMTIARRLLNLP